MSPKVTGMGLLHVNTGAVSTFALFGGRLLAHCRSRDDIDKASVVGELVASAIHPSSPRTGQVNRKQTNIPPTHCRRLEDGSKHELFARITVHTRCFVLDSPALKRPRVEQRDIACPRGGWESLSAQRRIQQLPDTPRGFLMEG